jgi:hypothetical protein
MMSAMEELGTYLNFNSEQNVDCSCSRSSLVYLYLKQQ